MHMMRMPADWIFGFGSQLRYVTLGPSACVRAGHQYDRLARVPRLKPS